MDEDEIFYRDIRVLLEDVSKVFRVFQNEHPDIELIPVNATPTVLGMVKHVRKS